MNLINRNELFNDSFFKRNDLFKADIYEKDNLYKIVLDLPGFKKENISAEYSNGYLNIIAIQDNEMNDDTNFIHRERFYGEYKRTFYVGCINENKVNAKYQDGILIIDLEKQNESNRIKQIDIK